MAIASLLPHLLGDGSVETTEASGTLSLWEALAAVPDHRWAEGKRYPLASPLLMAIAAMQAGRRDQLSIVRWGRRLSVETLAAFGIGCPRAPAPSVWCELFRDLSVRPTTLLAISMRCVGRPL
jgi:DDE_Tnp_1-associated